MNISYDSDGEFLELKHAFKVNVAQLHSLDSVNDNMTELYRSMLDIVLSCPDLHEMSFGETLAFNTLINDGIVSLEQN